MALKALIFLANQPVSLKIPKYNDKERDCAVITASLPVIILILRKYTYRFINLLTDTEPSEYVAFRMQIPETGALTRMPSRV